MRGWRLRGEGENKGEDRARGTKPCGEKEDPAQGQRYCWNDTMHWVREDDLKEDTKTHTT